MQQRWFLSGGFTLLGLAFVAAASRRMTEGQGRSNDQGEESGDFKKLEKPIPLKVKGLAARGSLQFCHKGDHRGG